MQLEGATYEAEKVSLRDLTQENIHVLTLMTIEKDMTLTNNIKKDTAFVDPDMARTVIQNLIFNAIKFTPLGGKLIFRQTSKTASFR